MRYWLLDRIRSYKPEVELSAVKNVTMTEEYLRYAEEELRRARDELRDQLRGLRPDRARSFWEADLEGSNLAGMTIVVGIALPSAADLPQG